MIRECLYEALQRFYKSNYGSIDVIRLNAEDYFSLCSNIINSTIDGDDEFNSKIEKDNLISFLGIYVRFSYLLPRLSMEIITKNGDSHIIQLLSEDEWIIKDIIE